MADAVVIGGDRNVARASEDNRLVVAADEPLARTRSVDRQLGVANAVVIGGDRDIEQVRGAESRVVPNTVARWVDQPLGGREAEDGQVGDAVAVEVVGRPLRALDDLEDGRPHRPDRRAADRDRERQINRRVARGGGVVQQGNSIGFGRHAGREVERRRGRRIVIATGLAAPVAGADDDRRRVGHSRPRHGDRGQPTADRRGVRRCAELEDRSGWRLGLLDDPSDIREPREIQGGEVDAGAIQKDGVHHRGSAVGHRPLGPVLAGRVGRDGLAAMRGLGGGADEEAPGTAALPGGAGAEPEDVPELMLRDCEEVGLGRGQPIRREAEEPVGRRVVEGDRPAPRAEGRRRRSEGAGLASRRDRVEPVLVPRRLEPAGRAVPRLTAAGEGTTSHVNDDRVGRHREVIQRIDRSGARVRELGCPGVRPGRLDRQEMVVQLILDQGGRRLENLAPDRRIEEVVRIKAIIDVDCDAQERPRLERPQQRGPAPRSPRSMTGTCAAPARGPSRAKGLHSCPHGDSTGAPRARLESGTDFVSTSGMRRP